MKALDVTGVYLIRLKEILEFENEEGESLLFVNGHVSGTGCGRRRGEGGSPLYDHLTGTAHLGMNKDGGRRREGGREGGKE